MQHREGTEAGGGGAGKASAVTVAGAVRENLERQVEERRRQAVAVAQLVGTLKTRIIELLGDVSRCNEENQSLRAEIERIQAEYDVLLASHRRLYDGFTSLLKAVEDTTGAQVGIDQRIEAVLLSSEVGMDLGAPADVTPARMGNLIEQAILTPARQAPALQTSQR